MKNMFKVRSPAVVHGPQAFSWGPARALQARTSARVVYMPYICPLLSTRQDAEVFNQPLSLNTSRVTTMRRMFKVRSPQSRPGPHPRPMPTRLCQPAPRSALYQCPLFDSAVREGVQSAAEL